MKGDPPVELTGSTFFLEQEVSLMARLQAHTPAALLPVLSVFSAFGEELVILLITGFLYWSYDKQAGKRICLTVLMVSVWCPMIKNVVARRRPYFDHEEIDILRVVEPDHDPFDIAAQGFSFPTGHSANTAGLFGSLAKTYRKRSLLSLAVLLPLLVGFSRVVVGAHYPTDVLAGWCVGTVSMLLVPLLDRSIPNRPAFYGLLLLTAVPWLFFCRSADFYSTLGLFLGFVLSVAFEERFVRFENTKSPVRAALRVLGGIALLLALNAALKAVLPSGNMERPAMLIRTLRYMILVFFAFGLYPAVFRYTARIGASRQTTAGETGE